MKIYIIRDCTDELITNEAYTSIKEALHAMVAKTLENTDTFTFDCKYSAVCDEYIVVITTSDDEIIYYIKRLPVVDGDNEK